MAEPEDHLCSADHSLRNAAVIYKVTYACLYVTLYITAWKTPVAAVTVYSAPDDGRKGRPKYVEHTSNC